MEDFNDFKEIDVEETERLARISAKLKDLTDGEYIDILDRICVVEFGMTSIEWIMHLYRVGGDKVREVIDEIPETDIVENGKQE